MWASERYPRATEDEVREYFTTNSSHLKLVLDDCGRENLRSPDLEGLLEYSDFIVVSEVGVVPTYWEDHLGDRNPEWASFVIDVFAYSVYKLLWFVVVDQQDYTDSDIEVAPISQIDVLINELKVRSGGTIEELDVLYFGWQQRQFPHGTRFVCLDGKFAGERIDDTEQGELFAQPYEYEGNMYAWIGQSDDGGLYVIVSVDGTDWSMGICRLEEAEDVLRQIWLQ